MSQKITSEGHEVPQQEPKLLDVSKDLYEGGKADETKLAEYIEIAKQKGLLDKEKLDLTGGTLMTIYMAVAAEAAKSGSNVKEIAFNNPGREGRLVLWNEALAQSVPELKKSLFLDQEDSKVDPDASSQVLDLRLTFRDNPEGPEMVSPAKAQEVMQQVIAQLREAKKQGMTTVRLTGFPAWLAEGASFAAVKENLERIIAFAPGKEVVVYDVNGEMMGKIEATPSQKLEARNPKAELGDVQTWRDAQKVLKTELPNNEITIYGVELDKLSPAAGLRMFDSIHAVAKSLTVEGIEVFQHRDPRTHDLVPKSKPQNSELLPKQERINYSINIHEIFAENQGDAEKTVLEIAKIAVNKVNQLELNGITTPLELAIAGKAVHAAHGLIESLTYYNPTLGYLDHDRSPDTGYGQEDTRILVKSWRSEA